MEKDPNEIKKIRGKYLLPNLLTTASLFSGFYAIVAGINGNFEISAIALFIAMIFDSLDGRIARLTGSQSAFGAQYDSISDMACFGVTPAILAYSWGLSDLGKIGWLVAFIYTAGTGIRLARFNSQDTLNKDNRYFTGLPCPAAAAVVASMVWIATDFDIPGKKISVIVAVVTLTAGLLMVSNIKYNSFKQLDLKEHVPFVAVLIFALLFALIAWDPPKVLFVAFFGYMISGPLGNLKNLIFRKKPENNKAAAKKKK